MSPSFITMYQIILVAKNRKEKRERMSENRCFYMKTQIDWKEKDAERAPGHSVSFRKTVSCGCGNTTQNKERIVRT